ncbi:MAG: hypothetical protein M3461_01460 [Pseudomonadota bacterium]|nr:hypothetical protein [Pseudomonadota bacterium]
MAHRITLIALDNYFASNVIGTVDLLHTANLIGARRDRPLDPIFEWQVLLLTGGRYARRTVIPCPLMERWKALQVGVVIIPALRIAQPERLAETLESHRPLLPWLKAQYEAGVIIAAFAGKGDS